MTSPPLSFPGSRELAGLWRQLSPFQPQRFRIGHFSIHRIEARVRVAHEDRLDPFQRGVLQALPLCPAGTPAELEGRLRLDRPLIQQVLRSLCGRGLVEEQAGRFRVSPTASECLASGAVRQEMWERRLFHFLDRGPQPATYLALPPETGSPLSPPDEWSFSPRCLRECIERSADWKIRHQFPLDVLAGPDAAADANDWRALILDSPEHWVLAIADVEQGCLGFKLNTHPWTMAEQPVFSLNSEQAMHEALGDFLAEPTPSAWQIAWVEWCHARKVPPSETTAARLEFRPGIVRVVGHRITAERLRALTHPQPWLLAGQGPVRAAARVEFA
jgi:hypothetical protein